LGSGTGVDILTTKYNSAAEKLWQINFTTPGENGDYPRAIALDGQGNVLVTGWVGNAVEEFATDWVTIKYSQP